MNAGKNYESLHAYATDSSNVFTKDFSRAKILKNRIYAEIYSNLLKNHLKNRRWDVNVYYSRIDEYQKRRQDYYYNSSFQKTREDFS